MVVRADGSIFGTIGGGPLEARLIRRAVETIETGRNSVERFDSAELGMMCGGGGHVLVEYVDPARVEARELFRGMAALFQGGHKGWVVTILPADESGHSPVRRCLVGPDGSVSGDRILDPETLRDLARRGGTYDRIVAGDPARTYVQPIGAQGTVYVFGAGHCGERVVPLLSTLGFFTVVVDDRSDFANRGRFPTADRIVVPPKFDEVLATLPVDGDSYIVIVTRGHSHDTSVLAQALRTEARYIGMIGSKKKVADTFEALRGQGFSADDLARVHAPIGLPIGAETPEEIAVSIAAELIRVRSTTRG